MTPDPRLVANFLLFQLGWLVSVLGAAHGWPLSGAGFAIAFLVLHHWHLGHGRAAELRFVLCSAAFGFLMDWLLAVIGIISFPAYAELGPLSPLWMASLWLMFAMTLRHSLRWLCRRPLLAGVLGAISGPFAYWMGSRFGAIHIHNGFAGLAAIGAVWAASMFCLLGLERITRAPARDVAWGRTS